MNMKLDLNKVDITLVSAYLAWPELLTRRGRQRQYLFLVICSGCDSLNPVPKVGRWWRLDQLTRRMHLRRYYYMYILDSYYSLARKAQFRLAT